MFINKQAEEHKQYFSTIANSAIFAFVWHLRLQHESHVHVGRGIWAYLMHRLSRIRAH